ncbi:MAG: ISKra4 family transposase [Candidatus Rokubacteria bacterium]|nr:ISKra4 family transposase [Candidatus Rokubacteria bacterium]
MGTIERAEREVQDAIDRVRRCAEAKGTTTVVAVERELWTALLRLGRAVMALFLARHAARPRPATYMHESARFVLDPETRRRSEIGTRFGKVPFARAIGRPIGGRGCTDLPIDRELGLCSGFSLGTVTAVVQLCALMAFGTARRLFSEFHEWAPSTRTTLRMVDAVGGEARGFLDADAVPDDDGEVLVIQVDGRGAPMISSTEHARRRRPKQRTKGTGRRARRLRRREHPRPRRKKGDKSKNAKIAFVGVIYTLRSTRHGWEGPINKRLIATFESHDALFRWLVGHAERRGYGRKRCFFLADGSDHIWRGQQKYFPKAVPCIDWYHVAEKLWEAGGCLHREGSAALREWVRNEQGKLRHGKVAELLDDLAVAHNAIPKTGPGNKGRRQRLLKIIEYLAAHEHRMPYAALRREDLDIGTGAVEGAVRNLVGLRLDGPGMRWGRDRAEMILRLRCIVLNGQWDAFCSHLEARALRLAAKPVPARTHDAERQQSREAA